MFVRTQRNGNRIYLLVVENEWVDGRVRQRVLHRLGRLDQWLAGGQLDGLLLSLGRLSEKLAVLGASDAGASGAPADSQPSRAIGPALIFERLWRDRRMGPALIVAAQGRRFEFGLERAVFLTVLHRLFAPGSDRAAEKWKEGFCIEGAERLGLHHLYRAMGWLGAPLPGDGQEGATPWSPRATKDAIEERLFEQDRDMFSNLDLLFFDTNSIYFEGEGGDTLGAHGHSKDHRPDLKQMVVGMVADGTGRPVCTEMWPGNTADVSSLMPVMRRMKSRFKIASVCLVADRGMISQKTMEHIAKEGWRYILGVRMRQCAEVRKDVLLDKGKFEEVYPKSPDPKAPSPLKVKEVQRGGRRYVVCLNEDEAKKEWHDRQAIVEGLRAALKHGDKTLVGNTGYRRFLKTGSSHFAVDEEKIKEEERYDGKWVLTSNTDLSPSALALKYKQLWLVEDVFRTMKSTLRTRPIYHKRDETIRGHVFCSFLALLMRRELEDRLAHKGVALEWADVVRELARLGETEIELGNKRFAVRSGATPAVVKVFQACGVALPPVVRQL